MSLKVAGINVLDFLGKIEFSNINKKQLKELCFCGVKKDSSGALFNLETTELHFVIL
jgi:hypothetical protein